MDLDSGKRIVMWIIDVKLKLDKEVKNRADW
jgi:hypothetical protein